ncbi:hypothetical protein ACWEPL_32955, partial [Nonomuraea sp. NPDC004186]
GGPPAPRRPPPGPATLLALVGAVSLAAAVTGAPLPLWYALAYTAGLVLVLRAWRRGGDVR